MDEIRTNKEFVSLCFGKLIRRNRKLHWREKQGFFWELQTKFREDLLIVWNAVLSKGGAIEERCWEQFLKIQGRFYA